MHIKISNGFVIDPANNIEAKNDIYIANGRIASVGKQPDGFKVDKEINADGLNVIPGLVDLRARLREVFDAPDAKAAAAVLNEALVAVVATPRVSVHDDQPPHLHFEPDDGGPVRRLGAVTAMGLAVALIEGGFDRLGICASTTCEDVFVDSSRNRSRSHCSDTCTTRENVAAFRKRQRGEA